MLLPLQPQVAPKGARGVGTGRDGEEACTHDNLCQRQLPTIDPVSLQRLDGEVRRNVAGQARVSQGTVPHPLLTVIALGVLLLILI